MPNASARKKIFELKFKSTLIDENIDWSEIVNRTHLYNSDDITNVCRDASLIPFQNKMNEFMEESHANYQ